MSPCRCAVSWNHQESQRSGNPVYSAYREGERWTGLCWVTHPLNGGGGLKSLWAFVNLIRIQGALRTWRISKLFYILIVIVTAAFTYYGLIFLSSLWFMWCVSWLRMQNSSHHTSLQSMIYFMTHCFLAVSRDPLQAKGTAWEINVSNKTVSSSTVDTPSRMHTRSRICFPI